MKNSSPKAKLKKLNPIFQVRNSIFEPLQFTNHEITSIDRKPFPIENTKQQRGSFRKLFKNNNNSKYLSKSVHTKPNSNGINEKIFIKFLKPLQLQVKLIPIFSIETTPKEDRKQFVTLQPKKISRPSLEQNDRNSRIHQILENQVITHKSNLNSWTNRSTSSFYND